MKTFEVTMLNYYNFNKLMAGENYKTVVTYVNAETREEAEKLAKQPGYRVQWIEDVEERDALNAKLKDEQQQRAKARRIAELKKDIEKMRKELEQLEK